MNTYETLILGASYGALLATKMLLSGRDATLVCLPAEADLINKEGDEGPFAGEGAGRPGGS